MDLVFFFKAAKFILHDQYFNSADKRRVNRTEVIGDPPSPGKKTNSVVQCTPGYNHIYVAKG